jgi:CheY-like chemotaxis protein
MRVRPFLYCLMNAGVVPPEKPTSTILLVDDEPSFATAWKDALNELGYQVVVAHSGAEALELWDRQPVDLLITDVFMNRMNGAELARALAERQPELRVLFISGDTITALAKVLPRGADLVSKPTSMAEIRRRVAGALRPKPPVAAATPKAKG